MTLTSLLVKVVCEYLISYFGNFAIQFTITVAVPAFPALSTNSNVNSPLSLNV